MAIGILALQGAVELHRAKLATLGAAAVPVRTAEELGACAGLIMPGGESTTLLNLIGHYGLKSALVEFAHAKPLWGVCAGAILAAKRVKNPEQESFSLVPITVRRNAYGRQNESFIAEVTLTLPGQPALTQEAVFIRAPRVVGWNGQVTVLAEHEGFPVALQAGRHLITTFHPELAAQDHLHRFFLSLCEAQKSRETA